MAVNYTPAWNPSTIGPNDSCIHEDDPSDACYRFITNGIFLNGIGFLGVLGNVISMIILSRPQMKSSINYLLIGLARVDTVLIITSILLFGLPGIYPFTGYLFTYFYVVYPHIVPVVYPLSIATHTASAYLTLTVTLERYVAVCHPLRARSLCTYGRARLYVIVIVLFSIVYNLPKLWEASVKSQWLPEDNLTVYCVRPSQFRMDETYVDVYVHWCYLIFMSVIPFGSLAVLNAAIYRQVRKANMERQRLSRLQRREIGLATMLLFVVLVFFICNLLPLVNNVIESFHIEASGSIINHMIKTSNLLVTINSSVNFIIYVIFGEKFKRLFLRLFCSHGLFSATGRDSPDGATNDDSFMSNGDRQSLRLQRQGTSISRNGNSLRLNGDGRRSVRARASSPGPCVYYPAGRGKKKNEISAVTFTTQTSIPSNEWDQNHVTTDF